MTSGRLGRIGLRVQLPSLGGVVIAAIGTVRRFPAALIAAVVSAAAAILTAEDLGPDALHEPLLAAASLGIPLYTALALVGERRAWSAVGHALAAGVAAAALGGVYAAWNGWPEPIQVLRYAQLSLAVHLMVAFVPFIGRGRPVAFWQYNRALFIRLLAAAASSGTIFAGLALALAALNKLFGADIPNEAYERVWFLIAFIFTTWFFLGGVPADVDALEQRRDYPAALRVFAQYTLVPLVSVYLVILNLYFGKVLVLWDWPSGWIGYLVSGVAGAGILALLLVHPVSEQPEQRWIGVFARDFWLGMLPAVVMLWLALYQRVHQYGLTEHRYVMVALSLWLGAMALYSTVTRSRNIRVIPVSLCVLALGTWAGPWSAFAVSERSQAARLRAILERNHMLVSGPARKAPPTISRDDADEINSTVRYLVATHGAARLRPWLEDSLARRLALDAPGPWRGGEDRVRAIVESFGVAYSVRWQHGNRVPPFSFSTGDHGSVPLAGFDYLVRIREGSDTLVPGDTSLAAFLVRDACVIRVVQGGRTLIDVPLDSMTARALRVAGTRQRYSALPPALLRADAANARVKVMIRLSRLSGQDRKPGPTVTGAGGEVLVRTVQ